MYDDYAEVADRAYSADCLFDRCEEIRNRIREEAPLFFDAYDYVDAD